MSSHRTPLTRVLGDMSLNAFEFLNANVDNSQNRVLIGSCNCKPKQAAFATLENLTKGFDVICMKGRKHAYSHLKLSSVFSGIKRKGDMKEVLESWRDFRQHLQDADTFPVTDYETATGFRTPELEEEEDADNNEASASAAGLGNSQNALQLFSHGKATATTRSGGPPAVAVNVPGARRHTIVLGQEYSSDAAQGFHGLVHVAKNFLWAFGPHLAGDGFALYMAAKSGDPFRLYFQMQNMASKYLPGQFHGLATELAMQALGNTMASPAFHGHVGEVETKWAITGPVPSPQATGINMLTGTMNETNERAAELHKGHTTREATDEVGAITGPASPPSATRVHVPPGTGETNERARRLRKGRGVREAGGELS
ncbi:hypothetical protein LTR37_014094 [Vermiconidia calcicola]|uniref:Uncharacterized protein n=1 Tax=Vermiconidia calcicola TaxID=1690605 RepID=A0ACC3MUM1_9PEZI|nr:hypothetical protein LTR37_014094 [Vermiconidia calcicola]